MVELDWLPLRYDRNDPLVLCLAGADSSFRLVEVNMYVFLSSLFFYPEQWKLLYKPCSKELVDCYLLFRLSKFDRATAEKFT